MAYFTFDEVMGILPVHGIDSATDKPPLTDAVTAMIPLIEMQIDDAVTRGGFTPPLTGNAAGAAGLRGMRETGYQILVTRGVTIDPKVEPLWLTWHEEFEEYLNVLAGTTEAGVAAAVAIAPSSYTMNAPDDPDSSVNPVFKRDQAHNW